MTNVLKVGKYEVQDRLGEGAMGVVYRALDPMLNRSVAVKVMNDALALDEDFRTRFLREARVAGSLQHPNIITVYDCGETDGHLYIAMEYVAGTDLERLMTNDVPLTVEHKIDLVVGVLHGLGCAHNRGIVHRDVKPANIRVNEEGRALIMDFGIAHTSSSNMTRTGLMLGTPNYMAPEQILGGTITPQTDIFAVGVVLYELLTNVKPFDGENLHSVMYKIVSEQPAPPEKVVTGLPQDLAAIVMKALSKEAGDRYASALEMANALTNASAAMSRGGAPAVSRSMSLRSSIDIALTREREDKGRGERRRRWQLVGAVAAPVVVLLLGATLLLRRNGSPGQPTAPAVQSDRLPSKTAPPLGVPVAAAAVTLPDPVPHAPAVARTSPPRASPAPRASLKGDAAATSPDMTGVLSLGTAESAARAGAAAKAAAATQPRLQAQAPPGVAAPPPEQPTPSLPPSNPALEIASVVAHYAKAMASRDVGELKHLYPGMSSAQESSFTDFFQSVRSLRAAFSVSNLRVDGTNAQVTLNGVYDFVTPTGRSEHQPVTLQAALRQDGSGWQFVSIR